MEKLAAKILDYAAAAPCRVRLLWQSMKDDEPRAQYLADERVSSASTIKVPIMLTLLQRVADGRESLDTKVLVEDILEDSRPFEQGPRTVTLEEVCRWMIILSDNTSTNFLIRRLGMEEINAYCQRLGLQQTAVRRVMLDFEALEAGRDNTTSACDQYICYRALYDQSILTPELCRLGLDMLFSNRDYALLYRYIPVPLHLAHKSGGLDFLSHDAGIFFLPREDYFLGVFVTDGTENQRQRAIGDISKWIYDWETES